MNNPFATVPTPAAHQPTLQPNPFAPQATVQQHQPSFPTTTLQANPFAAHVQATPPNFAAPSFPQASAPPANPFALVTQAPPTQAPPAPPTQGVAAIQAAFAAAPPLNPPGEAGLGLQPVAVAPVQVEAPAAPEPAPKARRSRKPKAVDVQGDVDAALLRSDVQGAIDAARTEPDEQDMTLDALNALANRGPTIDSATTEELRDALNARGWDVTLVAS